MTFNLSTVLFALSGVICCGILVDKLWREIKSHFSAFEQCRKSIDQDGNERHYWSFHSFRRNTVIGNTIGRVCVGIAAWRFHRRHSGPEHAADNT